MKGPVQKQDSFQEAQYLGEGTEREDQYAYAVENVRIATIMKPYYGTAWDCLGLIYESWEKWDSSLINYQRAMELDSNKFNKKDKIEALQLKSIGLDDEMFDTYFGQALEMIKNEEYISALAKLKKTRDLVQFHEDVLYCIGLCHDRLGNYDKAIFHYSQSLEVNPAYEKSLNNMGIIYFGHGQFEDAIGIYKRLLAINPQNLKALNNLGLTYMNMKEYVFAAKNFRKALKIEPGYETAQRNLTKIELLKQGIDPSVIDGTRDE